MPEFNKGDRVRVRLTSHSPYRGQTGVVDDDPSSSPHPSTGESTSWYLVRFDYRGMHPAVRLTREDLEAASDEMSRSDIPPVETLDRQDRSLGGQISRVTARRKYLFSALAVFVLVFAGVVVGVSLSGTGNSQPPSEFSPSDGNPPLLSGGSTNQTARLVFATEPGDSSAGAAFPAQPVVNIVDTDGNLLTDSSAPVTLTVTNNRATLFGETTVNAVNGVATFSDLSMRFVDFNYSLTAISPGAASAISRSFAIGPDEGVALAFIKQPQSSGLVSRFSADVAVIDTYGNVDTNSTAEISVEITPGTGTPDAILSGTTTQNARDGIASFNYLSIIPEKAEYRITASSPGLNPATSQSFNVAEITKIDDSQQ